MWTDPVSVAWHEITSPFNVGRRRSAEAKGLGLSGPDEEFRRSVQQSAVSVTLSSLARRTPDSPRTLPPCPISAPPQHRLPSLPRAPGPQHHQPFRPLVQQPAHSHEYSGPVSVTSERCDSPHRYTGLQYGPVPHQLPLSGPSGVVYHGPPTNTSFRGALHQPGPHASYATSSSDQSGLERQSTLLAGSSLIFPSPTAEDTLDMFAKIAEPFRVSKGLHWSHNTHPHGATMTQSMTYGNPDGHEHQWRSSLMRSGKLQVMWPHDGT